MKENMHESASLVMNVYGYNIFCIQGIIYENFHDHF